MHLHVRVKQVAATVPRRGSFRCAHCTHWQRAEVLGFGMGTVTLLDDADTARQRAQLNAARHADRILRFATCPKCGKRGHHRAFAGRYALMFVTIAAVVFLLGLVWPVFDHSIDADEAHVFRTWMPLFMSSFVALIVAWSAFGEWRKIDRRVRWLDF